LKTEHQVALISKTLLVILKNIRGEVLERVIAKENGLIVVIEGLPGSGRETQSRLLFGHLDGKRYDVKRLSLANASFGDIQKIVNAILDGKIVIANDYFFSAIGHVKTLESAFAETNPIGILLEIPIEASLIRGPAKSGNETNLRKNADRFYRGAISQHPFNKYAIINGELDRLAVLDQIIETIKIKKEE
jgi:hypothetical protein